MPPRAPVGTWARHGRLDALRLPAGATEQSGHGAQVRELPRAGLPVNLVPAETRAAAVVDSGHALTVTGGLPRRCRSCGGYLASDTTSTDSSSQSESVM